MGVVIPEGFAQANIKMNLTGKVETMVMTLGIAGDLDPSPDEIAFRVDQALTVSGSLFAADQVDAMSNLWSYNGVDVTFMSSTGPILASFDNHVAGEATQAGLVINGCLLVRKGTAAGGRKNRGRLYMPPAYLHEINVSAAGVIDSVVVSEMQARFLAFRTELVSNGALPVLLHSLAAGLPPTGITSFTVESLIATQRRRLR